MLFSMFCRLFRRDRFDEIEKVFKRNRAQPKPPKLNLDSYMLMVDVYCAQRRFDEAIEVFNSMGEHRCRAYAKLTEQLYLNGMLAKTEELYKGMNGNGVSPNVYTFYVLMDMCFKEDHPDDAVAYFKKMIDCKLMPNLRVYIRLMDGLIKAGKLNLSSEVDDPESFLDRMVQPVSLKHNGFYRDLLKALFFPKKYDKLLKMVGKMLREDPLGFPEELAEELTVYARNDWWKEELLKAELERDNATLRDLVGIGCEHLTISVKYIDENSARM